MTDRRLSPRHFDNTKPLVSSKLQRIQGVQYHPGETVASDDGSNTMLKLWMVGRVVYKDDYRPTAVQQPEADPDLTPDEIAAQEAERAAAEEKAKADQAATDAGFAMEQNGSWFTITGPGLDEPVKVQGEDAARTKRDELVEAKVKADADAASE
jgi:hypothetical protein